MRTLGRLGLALLMVLAVATTASAQDDRFALNATVGPSFGNVGTTFSTIAGLDVKLHDRAALVGEFGVLPQAPFRDASEIAPPVETSTGADVNSYHWNANLKVRPFEVGRFQPYVTGGLGLFTADTVISEQAIGDNTFEDRRRATDFSTNLGAGVVYRLSDWAGIGADYRTFFVHRDDDTPRVNRFTAGITLSVN